MALLRKILSKAHQLRVFGRLNDFVESFPGAKDALIAGLTSVRPELGIALRGADIGVKTLANLGFGARGKKFSNKVLERIAGKSLDKTERNMLRRRMRQMPEFQSRLTEKRIKMLEAQHGDLVLYILQSVPNPNKTRANIIKKLASQDQIDALEELRSRRGSKPPSTIVVPDVPLPKKGRKIKRRDIKTIKRLKEQGVSEDAILSALEALQTTGSGMRRSTGYYAGGRYKHPIMRSAYASTFTPALNYTLY